MYKHFIIDDNKVILDFDTYKFEYSYSSQLELYNFLKNVKNLIKLIKCQRIFNNNIFKLSYTEDGCGLLLELKLTSGLDTIYCLQRHTLYKNLIDISQDHFKFIRYEDDKCIIDNVPAWNVIYTYCKETGFKPYILELNLNGSYVSTPISCADDLITLRDLFINVLLRYGSPSFDIDCKVHNRNPYHYFKFNEDTIELVYNGIKILDIKKTASLIQYINDLRSIFKYCM